MSSIHVYCVWLSKSNISASSTLQSPVVGVENGDRYTSVSNLLGSPSSSKSVYVNTIYQTRLFSSTFSVRISNSRRLHLVYKKKIKKNACLLKKNPNKQTKKQITKTQTLIESRDKHKDFLITYQRIESCWRQWSKSLSKQWKWLIYVRKMKIIAWQQQTQNIFLNQLSVNAKPPLSIASVCTL